MILMKNNTLLTGLLLLFFLTLTNAQAQLRHTEFLNIGVENGLSHSSVTSIAQDSIGFIWVGTKHGLNRYDGTNFKIYSQHEPYQIGNDISVLKIDSHNRLWVGTNGDGLFLYNPLNDTFQPISLESSPGRSNHYMEIHALFEDKDGIMWIATEKGIYSYDASGKSRHYQLKEDKSDSSNKNDIRAMLEAPADRIWIGTFGSGLYLFDKKSGEFTHFDTRPFDGIKDNTDYINTLFTDEKGNLLVGTNGQGLKYFDFQQNRISNYLAGTPYDDLLIVRCIWQDKLNNLWIGTDGLGILHITRKPGQPLEIKNYQNNHNVHNSLSSNTINVFFEDRQSNLWIGSAKKGINLIKKETTNIEQYYSDGKGEYKIPVLSVFHDKHGLWLGTDGEGLTLLKPRHEKSHYEISRFFCKATNNGYVGDFIQCIKPANDGSFWIAIYAQGLHRFYPEMQNTRDETGKSIPRHFISHNNVQDILVLPSGDLWIATWGGGLVYFDTKVQMSWPYKHEPGNPASLGGDNVLALSPDSDGCLWLATYGDGLSMYNPVTKKFKNYKAENYPGLASNYIFALLRGDDNCLWLATKEGPVRFNPKTSEFETIPMNEADMQRRNTVSLLKDKDGNIWAGTQKGIMRIQKDNNQVSFIPGLYDNFCLKSAFKDEDGKLYFGSNERVVAFYPSQIQFETPVPAMCLTGFKLFSKPVAINAQSVLKQQICFEKKIVLKHNQSVFSIEYAALDYSFSKNINYEFKLAGRDEDWQSVGTQNTVTFTNLPSGKYTFMVRPAGEPSYQQATPAQIEIQVLPPFWLTWWAYLIYFALIIITLYLFRRYTLKWSEIKNELKLEKFKREQEEHIYELKQHFFTNISHDIRTPLTLIAGSINKLFNRENMDAAEQKYLKLIRTNTNRLLNLTGELLNFRKLETGNVTLRVSEENLVEFVQEIYISYTQFAINKHIEYKFDYSQPEISVWIDKVQFERAVCNLISNAFKYTPEKGEISVKVNYANDGEATVSVADTGEGIEAGEISHIFNRFYQVDKQAEGNGFGVGLAITCEIVLLHGGNIQVKSARGKGSEFTIHLQPGKEHLKNAEFISSPSKASILSEHFTDDEVKVAPDRLPEQDLKEFSVLLIEDNPDIRTYLTDLLSPQYSIYEASNGQEGFERALELVPDIIISDIMMPVMDGITFCRKLKSDMRISHIPVILLTARTLINSIIEGFETGADEYLTKPFDERILLTRVNNLLQNRKRIREQISKEAIINPQEISLTSQDSIFLSKLVSYIEEHIEEPELNIAQMASTMAMSHSNLYKKIKALTGMTVIGFVKDFRLKRAAQLLVQNQLNITEIAYMVGYSERRYFSDDFKKRFGQSPKEYMEKHKKPEL